MSENLEMIIIGLVIITISICITTFLISENKSFRQDLEIRKKPSVYKPSNNSHKHTSFGYPPMDDETKKVYDDAMEKHRQAIKEKRDSKIKPPLGLMPEKIYSEVRLNTVAAAIKRYASNELEIPIEWIDEYNRLIGKNNNTKG